MGKKDKKEKVIVGKRVKALREEQKLTLKELASKAGISVGFLGDIESGRTKPSLVTLNNLAGALGTTSDYLLGRTNDPRPISSIEKLPPQAIPVDKSSLVPVPIYGVIRAGEPMFVNEEILGYEYVLKDDVKNGDYFFLLVKGDSMVNARICEGDLILVRKQDWLENGDIGVIIVNSEETTIKRYYEQNGLVILKPENQAYRPQIYKPDEVIIVGKVVQIKIKL